MEILWRTLEIINWVVIVISTTCFFFQLVMILFFWLKEKHFPKSDKRARIAVLFLARNEEAVIGESVQYLLATQTYPKDHFDVYVVAHNCTDKTAEMAEKAGARVLVLNDPDPTHHCAGYAMQFGLSSILSGGEEYDFFLRFDADNHACPEFLAAMNDAYQAGVGIARPFEASTNGNQNTWTAVSATYYIRDSRIASNYRERLHLDSMLTGAGMMVASSIVKELPGHWDSFSPSEDSEFTLNRLLEKKRVHYVADAIVYEDQPSTMKDTWRRLTRMGHGLHGVFWKKGWRLLGNFFRTGRWSNVDLFMQLLMVPFTLLAFFWFVPYYVFFALSHLINWVGVEWMAGFSGIDGVLITSAVSEAAFWNLLLFAGIVIGSFLILYPLQTYLAMLMSKKKLGLTNFKGYKRAVVLSPLFMTFYGLAILIGVITRPKWKQVQRNVKN